MIMMLSINNSTTVYGIEHTILKIDHNWFLADTSKNLICGISCKPGGGSNDC